MTVSYNAVTIAAMAEAGTTIKISRSDRQRIEAFKVHPAQPTGEIVAQALDLLEEQRQRSAKNGASAASEASET